MSKCIYSFLLLLSLLSCIKDDAKETDNFELKAGDTLPAFSISNKEESLTATDLQGKVSLIVFFNTSCKDCQREFSSMNNLYNSYFKNPSVRMLMIARGQIEKEVDDYFLSLNYTFSYFADPSRTVYSLFADNTIPRLFLVGKDGKIVLTQKEYIEPEIVMNTIEKLLKEN
jgi:peroxiredoxin